MESKVILTTDSGAPVTDNQNSRTAGPAGPVLIEDHHLIEKLAHFDRERIPERVVHAKGSGAYGYFEVLANVTQWTKASFLAPVGKRTDVFIALLDRGGGERAQPTRCATPGALRSSSTPRTATTTWSAITRRSSLSAIRSNSPTSSTRRSATPTRICRSPTTSGTFSR